MKFFHWRIRHLLFLIARTAYARFAFPPRDPPNSYARFVSLRFLRSLGRTGSTILRRMIIKRGRVAWTFGKRPRFVQQSALTADRNTWTRATSAGSVGDRGCGKERSGSKGGVSGRNGLEGPGDFNRGLRAVLARRRWRERFCEPL